MFASRTSSAIKRNGGRRERTTQTCVNIEVNIGSLFDFNEKLFVSQTGYRNPYNSTDPYGLSPVYWHVFAARLAFVVIFEHLVFVITACMQFLIPDIPRELKTQMQREQLLAKEAKYQNGVVKAQEYEDLLNAIRDNGNTVAKGEIKQLFIHQ